MYEMLNTLKLHNKGEHKEVICVSGPQLQVTMVTEERKLLTNCNLQDNP